MNYKLTRRGFDQLTLSTISTVTVTIVLGSFESKTLVKQSPSKDQLSEDVLYGVRAGAIPGGVQMQSLDLRTGKVKDLLELARTITLDPGTQLTSFVAVAGGQFLLAGNPPKNSQEGNRNQLIVLGKSDLIASELKKNSHVKSLPVAAALTVSGLGIKRYCTDGWRAYEWHLPVEVHEVGKRKTQRIERKHLRLRTRLKRLARQTICFSKSELMHDLVIGLFINRYEFGLPI